MSAGASSGYLCSCFHHDNDIDIDLGTNTDMTEIDPSSWKCFPPRSRRHLSETVLSPLSFPLSEIPGSSQLKMTTQSPSNLALALGVDLLPVEMSPAGSLQSLSLRVSILPTNTRETPTNALHNFATSSPDIAKESTKEHYSWRVWRNGFWEKM